MKNNFRYLSTIFLFITLFFNISLSQEQEPIKPLDDLIQNEKNFAKNCAENGIRKSFLQYLDDNSIVFRPEPVSGKELYSASKDSTSLLAWGPEYAEISGFGDMGFTYGPWEFSPNKKEPPIASGHFISVWHKAQGNTWKLLIDLGVPHKKADLSVKNINKYQNIIETKDLPYSKFIEEKNKLIKAEKSFSSEASEKGFSAAFSKFTSDRVQVFRSGSVPFTDLKKIKEVLGKEDFMCSWDPSESNISLSGDLGYTYGIMKYKKDDIKKPEADSCSYLRIWRKNQDGNFKIALDICLPITDKK
jgi:ketosteroid isomerase-like protein